jgi:hypothetical protein
MYTAMIYLLGVSRPRGLDRYQAIFRQTSRGRNVGMIQALIAANGGTLFPR